MKEFNATGNG